MRTMGNVTVPNLRDAWPYLTADERERILKMAVQARARKAGPKTCANESCGALFSLQEGAEGRRSQRTTGVRFCSQACARHQATREHRRRQRVDS